MRTLKLTLTNALWIGGTDAEEEEVWKWTDSSPWGFSDWLNNEPNNFGFWDGQDCLAYSNMPGDQYKWRDCGRVFMFLCSKQRDLGKGETNCLLLKGCFSFVLSRPQNLFNIIQNAIY